MVLVRTVFDEPASGWSAPKTLPWLKKAMNDGSFTFFKKPSCSIGEGGTIPFMAMLGKRFPSAQFVITGVLEPNQMRIVNEFLHIPYAKKLTCCISYVLSQFNT